MHRIEMGESNEDTENNLELKIRFIEFTQRIKILPKTIIDKKDVLLLGYTHTHTPILIFMMEMERNVKL